jgi:hypothetical protein
MNQVITTHHFMAVETRLLSRPYVSCLTEIEMRKLLHFYLRVDFYKGKTIIGNNDFSKFNYLNGGNYKKVVRSLVEKGFIKTYKHGGKSNLTTTITLFVPLYDEEKKEFISMGGQWRNSKSMYNRQEHFAIIPVPAAEKMLADKSLSLIHVLLMFKLYRYCDYSLFGGVDPNVIFNNDGICFHPRITQDLGITEEDATLMLEDLEQGGYFFWDEVTSYNEQFDTDKRVRVTNGTDFEFKTKILKPTWQYLAEVKTDETDNN